jgi:lipopolysaccharide export LptBFGC system permease protein LptF
VGGFDSFSFIRASNKSTEIKRSEYKKVTGGLTSSSAYGYSLKDRGTYQYNTQLKDSIKVKSDWVDEDTQNWLSELIESGEAYHDDPTYGLLAINITNTKYDWKQSAQDKLFNVEIEFTYSFDRYSQRG